MRSTTIAVTIAAIVMMSAAFSPTASAGGHYDYGCGIAPGSGYVNYIRVANVTCRHGKKVSNKVLKKFCSEHGDCSLNSSVGLIKGTTYRNGWRCKVSVGYESYRAKCRKGDQRFLYLTGA